MVTDRIPWPFRCACVACARATSSPARAVLVLRGRLGVLLRKIEGCRRSDRFPVAELLGEGCSPPTRWYRADQAACGVLIKSAEPSCELTKVWCSARMHLAYKSWRKTFLGVSLSRRLALLTVRWLQPVGGLWQLPPRRRDFRPQPWSWALTCQVPSTFCPLTLKSVRSATSIITHSC